MVKSFKIKSNIFHDLINLIYRAVVIILKHHTNSILLNLTSTNSK